MLKFYTKVRSKMGMTKSKLGKILSKKEKPKIARKKLIWSSLTHE